MAPAMTECTHALLDNKSSLTSSSFAVARAVCSIIITTLRTCVSLVYFNGELFLKPTHS